MIKPPGLGETVRRWRSLKRAKRPEGFKSSIISRRGRGYLQVSGYKQPHESCARLGRTEQAENHGTMQGWRRAPEPALNGLAPWQEAGRGRSAKGLCQDRAHHRVERLLAVLAMHEAEGVGV